MKTTLLLIAAVVMTVWLFLTDIRKDINEANGEVKS